MTVDPLGAIQIRKPSTIETRALFALDIVLSGAFNYNPAQGNLMLTVKDFDFGSDRNLFLDADQNVGSTNIRISAFPDDFNQGLVTGIDEATAAVPEPASWAMLIAGFGLTGRWMRSRRTRDGLARA